MGNQREQEGQAISDVHTYETHVHHCRNRLDERVNNHHHSRDPGDCSKRAKHTEDAEGLDRASVNGTITNVARDHIHQPTDDDHKIEPVPLRI